MKHLYITKSRFSRKKILANWTNTADFIYNTVDLDEIKSLLRYEVLNKNREMIVQRLTIRLLNLMKQQNLFELLEDINELEGVGEEHRDLSKGDD